jgi:hypothetical protein
MKEGNWGGRYRDYPSGATPASSIPFRLNAGHSTRRRREARLTALFALPGKTLQLAHLIPGDAAGRIIYAG